MVRRGVIYAGALAFGITAGLRRLYDRIANEQVPDTLQSLIERLDDEERNNRE